MGPFASASEDVVPAGTYTLIPNTILMDNRGHCHLSLDASEDKRMVQVCAEHPVLQVCWPGFDLCRVGDAGRICRNCAVCMSSMCDQKTTVLLCWII
jgi:hypothetical protein